MSAAALDPAALERELEALRKQRSEASQRVRASRQPPVGPPAHARNAPGDTPGARPPFGAGRFGPDRDFGGPPAPRGEAPRAAGFRDGPLSGRLGGGPSPRGPLGPTGRDGPPRGRLDSGAREYGADYGRDRDGPNSGAATDVAPAPTRRRAVLSMVVSERPPQPDQGAEDQDRGRDLDWDRDREREGERDGQPWASRGGRGQEWSRDGPEDRSAFGRRDNHDHDERGGGGGRGLKRLASEAAAPPVPAAPAVAEDPDSRKRARRLLGRALLGTLQKFRQEDAQFQASEAATRRAELARKAEEKAAAESERLRRQAAEERSRKRQEELEALMDLNLATDIKVLELLYAKKLARRRALGAFLRADGVPAPAAAGAASKGAALAPAPLQQPQPVYWQPVAHCPATLAVKERQERELRDWEEAVLAELELEKDGLRQRAQARREGIAERRQRAAEARAAGGQAAAGGGEEEAEDHEALEAVELDAHADEHGGDAEQEQEQQHGEDANGEAREAARGSDKDGNGGKAAGAHGGRAKKGAGHAEDELMDAEGDATDAGAGAAAAGREDSDEVAGDPMAA